VTETKTDSKQETWTTWLALTTAILAVLAAVTTLYMGKFSSRAILDQGQETNQWSYYQAKSIKSYIYEIQQIAIMLASIAALTKKKHLWQFSLVTANGWLYYFLAAIFLF